MKQHEIIDESRQQMKKLRDYFRSHLSHLLATPEFADSLPEHLLPDHASQARLTTVIRRIKELASL